MRENLKKLEEPTKKHVIIYIELVYEWFDPFWKWLTFSDSGC